MKKNLYVSAVFQAIFGLAFFLVLVFLTAGTWNYWQGWLFLAVFAVSTNAFGLYLALYDKPLLERRMNAGPWKEKELSQKIIISLVMLAFFLCLIAPIFDYRYGLSRVPGWVSVLGNILIILAFLGIFWVIKVNTWAASNINVEPGQKVIETGPYAYVRHPMYASAFWLFVGMPLALGSWWSIGLIILFFPILLLRLLDEERILVRDLPGYKEYMKKVKYRLIPGVW